MDDHVRTNREYWNREAGEYQERHSAHLDDTAIAWGVWRIPEEEVGALGEIRGRDALEYGCGGAQFSIALAGRGARAVGMDLSEAQLAHARANVERSGRKVELVQADGEHIPFDQESFDVVFCDHGVMGFAEPERTIPEVARVLRPGGRFAFSMATPWLHVCWNTEREVVDRTLHAPYFDLHHVDEPEGWIDFQRPYGEWIRLLRRAGLVVEDLVELRPPEGAQTTYGDYAPLGWARSWPSDHVWVATKS